jgi:hypothetical protein
MLVLMLVPVLMLVLVLVTALRLLLVVVMMSSFADPPSWELLALLAAALAGSLHCAGMCGGFAVAASLAPPPAGSLHTPAELRVLPARAAILGQLLYHGGKTAAYVLLGSLAGSLGALVARAGAPWTRVLAAGAGLFLILTGARALGLFERRAGKATALRERAPRRSAGLIAAEWTRLGGLLLSLGSPLRPLYLGVLSGFLPCPLVYAFLAHAAASRSYLEALATMAVLGLGTAPVLLVAAFSASVFSPLLRARLVSACGLLMVLLGGWTWYRGWTLDGCCALTQ